MSHDDPIRLPAARASRFHAANLTREDARRQFHTSMVLMGLLVAMLGVGILANLAQAAGPVLH